jgi:hypothetical protein
MKKAPQSFWRKKIMKPKAKPAKKGKTLGAKKLEKKVPLRSFAPVDG